MTTAIGYTRHSDDSDVSVSRQKRRIEDYCDGVELFGAVHHLLVGRSVVTLTGDRDVLEDLDRVAVAVGPLLELVALVFVTPVGHLLLGRHADVSSDVH